MQKSAFEIRDIIQLDSNMIMIMVKSNETTMYKKSPLNVGFYIYAVDSDFAT